MSLTLYKAFPSACLGGRQAEEAGFGRKACLRLPSAGVGEELPEPGRVWGFQVARYGSSGRPRIRGKRQLSTYRYKPLDFVKRGRAGWSRLRLERLNHRVEIGGQSFSNAVGFCRDGVHMDGVGIVELL